MTIPLFILGIGSLVSGWIGMPEAIGGGNALGRYLDPIFHLSTLEPDGVSAKMEPLLMLLSFLVAILGALLAWYVYGLKHVLSQKLFKLIPGGKKVIEQKYYVDELYDVTVVRWVRGLAHWVSDRLVEQLLVNRLIEVLVQCLSAAAKFFKKLQVGLVRVYLAYVVAGAGLLIYLMIH
jgi:NADH-quinone oxidoreductase subunit L